MHQGVPSFLFIPAFHLHFRAHAQNQALCYVRGQRACLQGVSQEYVSP